MDRNLRSFVLGFLGGVLVGVLGALFIAPRPSEELRRQLRERSKALQEQAQSVAGEVRARSEQVLQRSKELIETATGAATERVQELRHRTQPETAATSTDSQQATVPYQSAEQPSAPTAEA